MRKLQVKDLIKFHIRDAVMCRGMLAEGEL